MLFRSLSATATTEAASFALVAAQAAAADVNSTEDALFGVVDAAVDRIVTSDTPAYTTDQPRPQSRSQASRSRSPAVTVNYGAFAPLMEGDDEALPPASPVP